MGNNVPETKKSFQGGEYKKNNYAKIELVICI